ncbi:MAG: hypothetical protein JW870_02960, partial [Candidatus Delongbacteria bacterium]|nr:hypothetical protein [Candidatus Delongbacteria bacterium]
SANAFAVYMEYTRDHRGRLLKTVMKVSKNGIDLIPATIVEANVYNEAGLLKTRYLHSQNGSAFLQRIDYEYNIRGWLTKINDPLLSSGEGDRFGMALYYNRTPTGGAGFYNGNIFSIKWASHGAATNQQQNFSYDRADRLTQSRTTNMGSHTLTYATNYTYDKNGNFTYLKRYGKQGQLIDDIEYGYKPESNRIDYAFDPIGDYSGIDDYRGTLSGTDMFLYDLNGNLSIDNYRSIAIAYNQFNLPMHIDFENKDKTAYIYTSSGQKTAREVTCEDSTTQTTHYMGPFVFTQSGSNEKNLSYLLTPNGRLLNKGLKGSLDLEWEYFLTDHLGNVRTVITPGSTEGIAAVKQINNYYPFGLKMSLECYNISDNRYMFGGYEFENHFELNWYDSHGRFYMPDLPRFGQVDPFAEERYPLSTYNYCSLNPTNRVDPTGLLDDDYFNKQGQYLGSDDALTDNVRIIDQKGWNTNAISSENGIKLISHTIGENLSTIISETPLKSEAIENIVKYYDSKIDNIQRNESTQIVVNQLNNKRTLMQSEKGGSISVFDIKIYNPNPKVVINIQNGRIHSELNSASNIMNTLVHEHDHQVAPTMSQQSKELRAINAQKRHITYNNTTDSYKKLVDSYEKYYKNKSTY